MGQSPSLSTAEDSIGRLIGNSKWYGLGIQIMRVFLFVLLLLPASAASAAFMDGNRLYEACANEPQLVLFYTAGVADQGLNNVQRVRATGLGNAVMFGICTKGITIGQMRDVVCRSLAENPSTRHLGGALLVTGALAKAFPLGGSC